MQQGRETVQRIGLHTQLHRFQHALKKSVFLLPRFQIGIIGKLLFPVEVSVHSSNNGVAIGAI